MSTPDSAPAVTPTPAVDAAPIDVAVAPVAPEVVPIPNVVGEPAVIPAAPAESVMDRLIHVAEEFLEAITPASSSTADAPASSSTADAPVQDVVAAVETVVVASLYQSPLSTILTICGKALQCGVSISSSNIVSVIHSVMESIESLKTLTALQGITGLQKKQLALDCLHWLVNNHTDVPDIEKSALNALIDSVAPAAIDVIINVSNGLSDLVETKVGCLEINTNSKLKVHTKTSSCVIV